MIRSGKNALVARLAPALLVWLAAPALAAAAPIRYDFGGFATYVDPTSAIPAGSRFEGSLVYDDAIPLQDVLKDAAGRLSSGAYRSGTFRDGDPTADGTGLEIRVGGTTVVGPTAGLSGTFGAGQTASGDRLETLSFGGPSASGVAGQVSFALAGSTGFAGGSLPSGLKLADLTYATVSVQAAGEGGSQLYTGVIDSLTATPVPEPAWTVAALLGAAAYFARRRRVAG